MSTCKTCGQAVPALDPVRVKAKVHYDQSPHEPGEGIYYVAESYGDLKFTGPSAYVKGWRVQKVNDVQASSRRRDLWVAVNTHDTHGKDYAMSSQQMRELARSCAQEWASWADGDVYGWSIEDPVTGDHIDSCWGYISDDDYVGGPPPHLYEDIKGALEEHGYQVPNDLEQIEAE